MRKFTWLGFILLFLVMYICARFQIEQSALFIFLATLLAIVPFFLSFEKRKPRPRDLMPIIVLSALSIAGRIILMALPNFKPVTAIVIIAGIAFGAESGFMTGALTAFVSNIFMGQGPWTAWQMLGWGLIGYVAGILEQHSLLNKSWKIIVYGALSSFFFGIIMDSWTVFGFVQPLTLKNALIAYTMGIPFNISHSASTVAFLLIIQKPWLRQLKRIKVKYNLNN